MKRRINERLEKKRKEVNELQERHYILVHAHINNIYPMITRTM